MRTGLLILLLLFSLLPTTAQDTPTQLTLGISPMMRGVVTEEILDTFETEHPGIEVTIIEDLPDFLPPPPQSVDDVGSFLQSVQEYASSADVLAVNSSFLSREVIRAGILLDLTPLLAADPDAAVDDFYPGVLEAFQWEGKTWALPISGALVIMLYDAAAFDDAGVAYPDAGWTVEDFIHASETLDTATGLIRGDTRLLLRALLGREPDASLIDDFELVDLVEAWQPIYVDMVANRGNDPFSAAMLVSGTIFLADDILGEGVKRAPALLPGGAAGLSADGFAVSAGTAHPELAYELAQYLTRQTLPIAGDVPARRSVEAEIAPYLSETLLEEALANALSEPDYAAFVPVLRALEMIRADDVDAQTALQQTQLSTADVLEAIEQNAGSLVLAVETPLPPPSGEGVTLVYGTGGHRNPLPNRALWESTIETFVAQDDAVDAIRLDTKGMSFEEHAATQDCFFASGHAAQSIDRSLILNIDPLLAADPTFQENDFVTGVLQQYMADGHVWALPMTIEPMVMWYNAKRFQETGVPLPHSGWTAAEFADALRQIGILDNGAPFRTDGWGDRYLMLLIAAFGGQLIDETTIPHTFLLDDPQNIDAVRQVLDLARDGLIHYQALSTTYGGHFGGTEAAIHSAYFDAQDYRLVQRQNGNPYRVVTFPRGTDYIPVEFASGALFISANTLHPEACYRWISYLSRQAGLNNGMPARRSVLDDEALRYTEGDDLLAFYREFDAMLQDPDVLLFTPLFSYGGIGDIGDMRLGAVNGQGKRWMLRAFDRYVLEGADLEGELDQVMQFIPQYAACVETIEPYDFFTMTEDERIDYFAKIDACVVQVDPSWDQ